MLCQQCEQRPASVHVTQIINNEKREMHLCDQCAKQQEQMVNFTSPFSINDFLTAFLGKDFMYPVKMQGKTTVQDNRACDQCGMTYEQFARSGKLGCNNCYHIFADTLSPVFKKIHGNTNHNGKLPQRTGATIKVRKEVEHLKALLNKAIQGEEYERAAELRDQIRQLEGNMKGEV